MLTATDDRGKRYSKLAPELGTYRAVPLRDLRCLPPDNCGVYRPTSGRAVIGAWAVLATSIAYFACRAGMDVPETLKTSVARSTRPSGLTTTGRRRRRHCVGRDSRHLPLDGFLPQWAGQGCFMYTLNHPRLGVSVYVAKALLQRMGEKTLPVHALDYLQDTFAAHVTWPVYPEIARATGHPWQLSLKPSSVGPVGACGLRLLDLEQFVSASFEAFHQVDPKDLACDRPFSDRYRQVFGMIAVHTIAVSVAPSDLPAPDAPADTEMTAAATARHPYAKLPAQSFWSRSVCAGHQSA